MSEIEIPAAADAVTGGGGGNGFLALSGRIAALTTAALRLKEGMFALKRHMETNATAARTLSEMCHQAEVDTQFTAQILGISQSLTRVATGAGQLADTADTMAAHASGFRSAHESEYRGIYEAVSASSHRQAKPGFYRVQ
ncbi:hypothetical protein [Streptacidiphilus neutrinimicus]|uniref:hypothetical protein n=1 Tax=Streptacidiphilus neutrinimicus TaxID=105420 RepID=UPI0005A9558A|nr:hypothetical protein [Streptacidiphilus neutrinimicus]